MEFKNVWEKIVQYLNENKKNWEKEILELGQVGKCEKRQSGELFSNEELFEGIVLGILSRGANYRTIHENRRLIKAKFRNYEITENLLVIHDNDKKEILAKLQGRFNEDNIDNAVKSYVVLKKIISKYKSIDAFIKNECKNNVEVVINKIGKSGKYKLAGVGEVIASEIVKNWGFEAVKADQHILRAYACCGWIIPNDWVLTGNEGYSYPIWTKELNEDVKIITKGLSNKINKSVTYIDNVIWYLCAKYGCYLNNHRLAKLLSDNRKGTSSFSGESIENYSNTINEISIEKYFKKIKKLLERTNSGSYEHLTQKQKELYDFIKKFHIKSEKTVFTSTELKNEFEVYKKIKKIKWYWGCQECVITDFCYNKVNIDDKQDKFLFSPEKGKFTFVDFEWKTDEKNTITWEIKSWRTFTVGTYVKERFRWDFKELENELDNTIS